MVSATERITIAIAPRLRASTSASRTNIKSTPRTTICGNGKPPARAAGITNRMRSWIVSTKLSNCSRNRPRQIRVILTTRGCLARGRAWVIWTMDSLALCWSAYGGDGLRYSVNGTPLGARTGRQRPQRNGRTRRLYLGIGMVGFRHPRGRGDGYRPLSPGRISLPRYGSRVGLHIVLFEACSAFTRVAACTLALSPIRDTLIEGFSHFVTSMTAPIASGWSACRVGLAPTGKAPPSHGARQLRTSRTVVRYDSAIAESHETGSVRPGLRRLHPRGIASSSDIETIGIQPGMTVIRG